MNKLRFKNDLGNDYPDWEHAKLCTILEKNSKKNKGNVKHDVESITNKLGFVKQQDHFVNNDVSSANKSNYYITKKGLIGYNPSRIDVGSFGLKETESIGLISPLYVSFYCKEIDPTYMIKWMKTTALKRQMHARFEGSVRKTLSWESFSSINIFSPCLEEQKRIGDFLSNVDELIKLKQKEIDLIKHFDKANMFLILEKQLLKSKTIKIKDLCLITTGKLNANAMCSTGKYRFYTCSKTYFKIDQYLFDTEALLISGNGAAVGYIHYFKGKFNAYQRTYILKDFNCNIKYVEFYLQQKLNARIFSQKFDGNIPYIVLSTLSEMEIMLPSVEIQNQISSFYINSNLNINFLEQELTNLNLLKKAMLEKLFI